MNIREARLYAEYASMNNWQSDVISWVVVGKNDPPEKYEFSYRLKSIIGFSNGKPILHTGFKVVVEFFPDYPRSKPDVHLSANSKPWPIHPNIWADGRFSFEATDNWIPGIGVPLDSICEIVGEILAYQYVNTKSCANCNSEMLAWIHRNLEMDTTTRVKNPIDSSIIRIPDLQDFEIFTPESKDSINWEDETSAVSGSLVKNLTIMIEQTGKRIPVIEVNGEITSEELLFALAKKINLPDGTKGVFWRKSTHQRLLPKQTLFSAGIRDEEVLIADFERTAGGGGTPIVVSSSNSNNINVAGRDVHSENIKKEIESKREGIKSFKISVAYPKLFSKKFESVFLLHIYNTEVRPHVTRNIRSVFGGQETNEQIQTSSISQGQSIRVRLFSPAFDFPESVTKLIDSPINKIALLGMPKDHCEPGLHKILISILDTITDQEFESFTIDVRVADYAFDHVSRPMLSKASAVILGISSFVIFLLTTLEQIDKTMGLTSGTAAGIFALAIYSSFYNLYQRIRPSTP